MQFSRFAALVRITSRLGERLADGTLFVCKILLSVEVLITGFAVFYRYVLVSPLPWSEEIARFILIWIALLGASVVTQRREQLRLDSFYERFHPRMRVTVDVFLSIVVIALLVMLLPYAWRQVTGRALTNRAAATQIPMVYPQSSLVVGFVLLILQTFFNLLEDLLKLFHVFNGGSEVQ